MDIVLIGTGNVATILGKKLQLAGHRIVQVWGRDAAAASELAYALNCESTNYWSVVTRSADLYIIAVSDVAIAELIAELHLKSGTLVHTAASVPKSVLEGHAPHWGVFYPLQSLRSGGSTLPPVTMIVEGSDPATEAALLDVAESFAEKVSVGSEEMRAKLHVAAVVVSNFTNHLYTLASAYCQREGLDFALLQPLIEETAQRLRTMPPQASQTGPAHRGDAATVQKHLDLLAADPRLQGLYRLLSDSIQLPV